MTPNPKPSRRALRIHNEMIREAEELRRTAKYFALVIDMDCDIHEYYGPYDSREELLRHAPRILKKRHTSNETVFAALSAGKSYSSDNSSVYIEPIKDPSRYTFDGR